MQSELIPEGMEVLVVIIEWAVALLLLGCALRGWARLIAFPPGWGWHRLIALLTLCLLLGLGGWLWPLGQEGRGFLVPLGSATLGTLYLVALAGDRLLLVWRAQQARRALQQLYQLQGEEQEEH
jgi:hypothetical protein